MRIGHYALSWEMLARFIRKLPQLYHQRLDQKVSDFVMEMTHLKALRPEDPKHEFLDLALRFRNRAVSKPVDKLIGLLGLPHLDNETMKEIQVHCSNYQHKSISLASLYPISNALATFP